MSDLPFIPLVRGLPAALSLAAAAPWKFDPWSALIGAIITAMVMVLLYIYREALQKAWATLNIQIRQMYDSVTAGVEARYYDGLANRLRVFQALPNHIPLEALYIAPSFVTPQPRPTLAEEPPLPPQIILGTVWQSTRRVLVTGRWGSGRTALLIHLARTFITQNRQATYDADGKQIPIYVHLAELREAIATLTAPEDKAPAPSKGAKNAPDPADPIAANVTAYASLLIKQQIGGLVRKWLGTAEALVLIDGLDELGPSDQARAMIWISQLVERYPQPRYVVAAPMRGYGTLADANFVALPLADWTEPHITELARRWSKVNQGTPEDTARLGASIKPAPGITPVPLDLTLAAVVWRKTSAVPNTSSEIYNQVVNQLLEEIANQTPLSPMLSRAALGRLATLLLKEGRSLATRVELEKIIIELLPVEARPETAQAPEGAAPAPTAAPSTKLPKGVAETIEAYIGVGLLAPLGSDQYTFSNHRFKSYWAAWNVAQLNDTATLMQRLDDPAWADVFEFCAGLINLVPLVDIYLKQPDDFFRTRLWTVVTWASGAPPEATWRGRVLSELARTWMLPNQLAQVSEKALYGLLSTKDKGLPYLFKKAMAHPTPHIRAQAVRGIGLLAREADLAEIAKALQDPELEVREAAVYALGHIPSEATVEPLIDTLLEADESMRQVAAEALAKKGEKGHAILRDATKEEDLLVRRAATFGLSAVGEEWAFELLGQVERQDSQWMVRSAATEALQRAKKTQQAAAKLDLSPLSLDEQGWLVEWGATRGMSVGLGRTAMPVLMRALAEGDAQVKLAAIRTIARMGDADMIIHLRPLLGEPDPTLRAAAFRTIAEISARTGKVVPA